MTDYERGRLAGYAEGVEAAAGIVRRWHISKGGYGIMEEAIRALRAPSPAKVPPMPDADGNTCACGHGASFHSSQVGECYANNGPMVTCPCRSYRAPSPKEDAPREDDNPRLCVDCRHYGKASLGTPCEPCLNDWAEGRGASGWVSATNPTATEDAPRLEPETLEALRRIAPPSTHRCIVCGAHWCANPPTKIQPHGSWSLRYGDKAGPCCDNAPMGPQLVPLPGACFACQGTGAWSRLWAEANGGNPACPDCGGTGRSTTGGGR